MRYVTTITRKGQMTVPKPVRETLGLRVPSKVILDYNEAKGTLTLAPVTDIIDLAGSLTPEEVVPATEIRERMERDYGSGAKA